MKCKSLSSGKNISKCRLLKFLLLFEKNFSRQHFEIFFLIFPRKQTLTFHANCLLSQKIGFDILKCQLLKVLPSMLSTEDKYNTSYLYHNKNRLQTHASCARDSEKRLHTLLVWPKHTLFTQIFAETQIQASANSVDADQTPYSVVSYLCLHY